MRRLMEQVGEASADEVRRKASWSSTAQQAGVVDHRETLTEAGWTTSVFFGGAGWWLKFWEFGHRGGMRPFLRPGVQAALARWGGRFRSK